MSSGFARTNNKRIRAEDKKMFKKLKTNYDVYPKIIITSEQIYIFVVMSTLYSLPKTNSYNTLQQILSDVIMVLCIQQTIVKYIHSCVSTPQCRSLN